MFVVAFLGFPLLLSIPFFMGFSKRAQGYSYIFNRNTGDVYVGEFKKASFNDIKLIEVRTPIISWSNIDGPPTHHLILIMFDGKEVDLLQSVTHNDLVEIAKQVSSITNKEFRILLGK